METVLPKTWKQKISPNLRGTIVFLVTFFAVGAFMPFVNLAFDQRGLSESQIGLYNALPGAITIISGPILCRLADKKRARVMFSTIGFLMLAVFTALMTIHWGFLWLLSLQIIYSAFSPPITPIRDGLAARMANKYGLDFGNWRLWGSLGFAVASLVMGMVWQRIGIEWLFLGAAALFLLSGVVVNLLEEPEEENIIRQTELWHQWIPRESVVWLFLSAVFLSNLAQQAFYQFSAIHMIRLGGSETMAGMMRSASAVVEIPTMYLVSKLIRKIGPMWAFLIGASIFALSWLGFSLATAGWMLIAITAFRGIGFGFTAVSAVVYIDSKARVSEVASYQGLMNILAFGLAPLIAGPVFGSLAQRLGLPAMFGVASGVGWSAAAVCIVILLLQRRQRLNGKTA
jgi:MFS transporter, PPP family, 3-phenylpropionic acid transporter